MRKSSYSFLIVLGIQLDPWLEGASRKPVATSKFYFTDCGIANAAAGYKDIAPSSERWGVGFEQAVALEINAFLSYSQKNLDLHYWRTESGVEVDFIIDGRVGIEVKASQHTSNRDHKHLVKLKEEGRFERLIVINTASKSIDIDGVAHLKLEDFVSQLWRGEVV